MVSVSQYLKMQEGIGSLSSYGGQGAPVAEKEKKKPKWWEAEGYRNKWEARKGGQIDQLDDLYAQLLPLIEQATQGAFLQQTEALGAGREHSMQLGSEGFAAAGGNPSQFFSGVQPEIDRGYFEQVGELRGAAQTAQAGSEATLLADITSGKLGIENFFEGLRSQEKIGEQTAGATKEAGQLGLAGGIAGLLGSLIPK